MSEYEWVFFQALSDLVRLVIITAWIVGGVYIYRLVRGKD